MAVSKRLRFEILRRDNHACRYCGQTAESTALVVDHVIPVALGGNDEPTNLVTACRDCNSGKSSVPLDAPAVADIGRRASEWSRARSAAMEAWREDREEEDLTYEAFASAWQGYRYPDGEGVPLHPKWRDSVMCWVGQGFTVDDLVSLMPASMGAEKVSRDGKWRYYCGVVWRTLDKIEEGMEVKPPTEIAPELIDAVEDYVAEHGIETAFERYFMSGQM